MGRLTITKKNDFQNLWTSFQSFLFKNIYVANTSGSSGNPFTLLKIRIAMLEHGLWKMRYNDLGLSFSSKEARFFGHVTNIKQEFLKNKRFCLKRHRFNVFDLSDKSFNSL